VYGSQSLCPESHVIGEISTAALNRSHRDLWMSVLLNIWIIHTACMIKESRKERRLVAWLAGSPYLGGKVIVEARYQAS
jgi:hypothetical protein